MAQNSRRISDAFAPFRNPYSQSEQALMSPVPMAEQYASNFGRWEPPAAALMSPVPMAEQYASSFGMWAPLPGGRRGSIPAQTTRDKRAFAGETLQGAIPPSTTEFVLSAAEKQRRKEAEAQTRKEVDQLFSYLRHTVLRDNNHQDRQNEPWRGGRTYLERLHGLATRMQKRYPFPRRPTPPGML